MPQSPFPRRRRYRTPVLETQEVLLPFVIRLPGRTYPHYWQMPPAPPTAAEAHAYGRECAAHVLQWFKDNPAYVGQGLLSSIARDIDFSLSELIRAARLLAGPLQSSGIADLAQRAADEYLRLHRPSTPDDGRAGGALLAGATGVEEGGPRRKPGG
ncbi:hypothetical protein [Chromobacterium haemolyticum]|uniref:hypothetical protein n=1 Tax=Chromobacterium haemolyticum TaxID=394935 RepID=UPI0013B46856|nr:hypothetical protein [Chromobacterium haemolyticum]